MTWVVAGRGLFCATAMSDIQVTLTYPNGHKVYVDALQKVHFLHPRIAILFSGSVELALAVIRALRKEFVARLDPRFFAEPILVAQQLRRSIRYFYESFRDGEETAQFITLITPFDQFKMFGVYKLCPPAFTPITHDEPFGVVEIGSGSAVDEYRDMIQRNSVGIVAVDRPGERPTGVLRIGRVPMLDLSVDASAVQQRGISHGVFLTLMSHELATYEYVPPNPDDPEIPIATTWTEFVALMKDRGIAMADAVATAS